MSRAKHCLRWLSVAEVYVRDCKAQTSPFLSLKSFRRLENIDYALAKYPVISSFPTGLQLEWRQLEVSHGKDVQFDGSVLQEGQKACEMEWLARTLKNMRCESVSVQDDEILNPCEQCSLMWQLESEDVRKQIPLKFHNLPSSRVETGHLDIQQEDMFEMPVHTFHFNLRLLAFIFTSLLLLFVYLCL
jgi:hypothetical protein